MTTEHDSLIKITVAQSKRLAEQQAEIERLRAAINEIYELACTVGQTFMFIRIGEDHPKVTETRLELDAVYTPLAKKLDALYESVNRVGE